MPRQFVRAATLTVVLALTAGCAFLGPTVSDLVPRSGSSASELHEVPFFPQEEYQCGPAALATVLNHTGVEIDARSLIDEVYLPGRRGSLQLELLGSARRHSRMPYRVRGGLPELLAHVDDGYPVLVFQNLGFKRVPRWHYAVVVGYSATDNSLVLRSGTNRRASMTAREFLRKWEDGGQWAILTLRPGDIPPAADADEYLAAAASLEDTGHIRAAHRAYQAASARWPAHPAARLGLANTAYTLGDLQSAESTLRALVEADPDHVVARNNLAHVLAERGCHGEARKVLEPVLADERTPDSLMAQVRSTWSAIDSDTRSDEGDQCPRNGSRPQAGENAPDGEPAAASID